MTRLYLSLEKKTWERQKIFDQIPERMVAQNQLSHIELL